ncbi:unnamed protein product [Rotaria sp. Silwood1]|nr:unnamed protein product [Rotaria sp. Silwood1]
MKSKTKLNQCQFQLRMNHCSLSKFQNYTIINQYCEIYYKSLTRIHPMIDINYDINHEIFSLTLNSTIQVSNSTEKYVNYAIILLISLIVLSLIVSIILNCIQRCRKRKFDVIKSPSATDVTSENSRSYTNTT